MATTFNATGSGAMSETFSKRMQNKTLSEIRLNLSSVGATAESFVVTLDSGQGTEYDVVLHSQDMNTFNDLVIQPERRQKFSQDDALTFTYTNTDASTWGLEVIFEEGRDI